MTIRCLIYDKAAKELDAPDWFTAARAATARRIAARSVAVR